MVTRGRETQDMGNTGLTLLPPPERCVPHRKPSNGEGGGGRSGGLKGHGDRTGQEASRAVPVPEPMAERGAREAMADRVAWAAMADPGTREAMADQGTREAMAGPPPRPRPPPRHLRLETYYPPKIISLGEIGARSGTWGRSGGTDSWGRSGGADTWGRSGGAGTAKCIQGAGTGGRCRGAGSGGRCRGAGTGLEGAVTGWLATGTAGGLAILTAGRLAILTAGGVSE